MIRTIEKLGDGDLYVKMDAPFSIREFERVRIAFNHMVERIRQLKITSMKRNWKQNMLSSNTFSCKFVHISI